MKQENRKLFLKGVRDGLPIGLGYFAVSFSLGIMAKVSGLSPFQGFLASLLTNASAGEYAGFVVIAERAGYFEMMLMTLVASARYFLMACALSQRFSSSMKFYHRLLIAFDLTDEIFATQISRDGFVRPAYTYGVFVLPLLMWSGGTLFGILMGNVLPAAVVSALSVALYGMFIAIVIPAGKKSFIVMGLVLLSFGLSFLCSRLPYIRELTSGTRTILLTVLISGAAAAIFPIKEKTDE